LSIVTHHILEGLFVLEHENMKTQQPL